MIKIAVMMLSLFIVGCSGKYVAPVEGDTALLEIRGNKQRLFMPTYSRFTVADEKSQCGILSLNPLTNPQGFEQYVIPADAPIIAAYFHSQGQVYCNLFGGFRSEKDKQYRVISNLTDSGCSLGVYEFDGKSTSWYPVKLKRAKLSILSDDRVCMVD